MRVMTDATQLVHKCNAAGMHTQQSTHNCSMEPDATEPPV
jgi:hypothetical protein